MSADRPTYEELEKRLAEAEETIRNLPEGVLVPSIETIEHKNGEQTFPVGEEPYRLVMENENKARLSFLDSVMEQSPFAMWIADLQGTVIRTNNSLCQILNLTDEQIVGKYNVLEDGNLEEQGVMNQVRAVFEEHKPARFNIPWAAAKAGDVDFVGARDLWIDVSMFPITDVEGNLTNVACQWVNITECKQAEEALKDSELKFKILTETIEDVFWMSTPGLQKMIYISPSYEKIWGRSLESLYQDPMSFMEIVHPEDRDRLFDIIRENHTLGRSYRCEYRIIPSDGCLRWVSERGFPVLDEDGNLRCMTGVCTDITEHKKAEEAREREIALREVLLDNLPCVAMILKKDSREIIASNKQARKMGAVPGTICYETCARRKNSCPFCLAPKLWETGESQRLEVEYEGAYYEGIWLPLSDGLYVHYIFDITEHKQTQKEVESLSKFPSENPSPVLRVGRDGTLLYRNEAARPLLARLETEVGGLVPSKWCSLIDEAFESAMLRILEEEIDSKIFSFVIAPIVDEDYVNLYGRDITVLKKVESELRLSEERFKHVVENAGDWIWEVDAEGLYTYVSPVVERVLGYTPEEIVGQKHFYDFFAPDVKESLKNGAFEVFVRRESFTGFVNPNVHKNGSTIILETSGTPVIDEKGNLCGYRGADRDITERTRREEELHKLNKDLVLASRRAGMAEVATDVLHNVGNVLNSINVSAGFIKEKISNSKATNLKKVIDLFTEHTGDLGTFLMEDERGKHIPLYLTGAARVILDEQVAITEKLQSLTKNVEHLKHIIKAQQNYARWGGVETFSSLPEVIEDAVEINHAALERYGIDLQIELAELPRLHIDKQRVLQILVNLITNARQALTESEAPKKVLIIRSYRHSEETIRVEVADNGIGISQENMPKVFTHGFTTKRRGHGFGLHSSAVAAREMGGSLTVDSDGPGRGAVFTLELPFKQNKVVP